MFIVERVTMKGGIVVFEMRNPLKAPTTTPESSPERMATHNGSPSKAINPPAMTPLKAIVDPTERSMPPRIITIVIAQATYKLVAT
jgi:hypothetical protein